MRPICKFPDCGQRTSHATGLCASHAAQESRGMPLTPIPAPGDPCRFPDCEKPVVQDLWLGLCTGHLQQWKRRGELRPLRSHRRLATTARETRLQRECRQVLERLGIPRLKTWDEGLAHRGVQ